MKKELRQLLFSLGNWKRAVKVAASPEFKGERIRAEIIRNVHSIEKGMCIENPRLGFGVEKLNNLFRLCEEYKNTEGCSVATIYMVHDVINEYIEFHKAKGFESPTFNETCTKFEKFSQTVSDHDEKYGGTLNLKLHENCTEELQKLFDMRHSIRDFEKRAIPDEVLTSAVKMAQSAPSACNRQAVRVYAVSSKQMCDLYGGNLDGIGGFAESADKFLLITGKLSAYRLDEDSQFAVSASIFVSYLTLALTSHQIGSCIVQRPLRNSPTWQNIKEKLSIPHDEQLVCAMAIGYMKDYCTVPISKRLPVDEVLKIYNTSKGE